MPGAGVKIEKIRHASHTHAVENITHRAAEYRKLKTGGGRAGRDGRCARAFRPAGARPPPDNPSRDRRTPATRRFRQTFRTPRRDSARRTILKKPGITVFVPRHTRHNCIPMIHNVDRSSENTPRATRKLALRPPSGSARISWTTPPQDAQTVGNLRRRNRHLRCTSSSAALGSSRAVDSIRSPVAWFWTSDLRAMEQVPPTRLACPGSCRIKITIRRSCAGHRAGIRYLDPPGGLKAPRDGFAEQHEAVLGFRSVGDRPPLSPR